MESAMRDAVDYIMYHYEKTGQFMVPTLNSMYGVSDSFYRDVITAAFHSASKEKEAQRKNEAIPVDKNKKLQEGFKRMSGKWPTGIPKSLTGLEKIFRDRRYWPKIMKRSKRITDTVRKRYLSKLKIKFDGILPDLDNGIISPQEGKKVLMEAWEATKPRVELIFRTETTTYFGKTQVAFFADDDQIIGFLFDALRDRATTQWCRTRHGLIYRPGTKLLSENTPACHWNCRSHLIPLANIEYNRKLLEDPNRDPENRKVEPLPSGWRK